MSKRGGRAAAVCAAVVGALIAMPVHGTDEKSVLPQRPDNAALNYLLAAAQLERAKTEVDIKAIAFIEGDFQKLPPAALKACPDAVDLLKREAGDQHLMLDIHIGAGKPMCQFDVDWEQGPDARLGHLARMRSLARHAIAVAKYHEFAGHPEKAGAIYADVERMSVHMAEEPAVISGLVTLAVNAMNVHAVEGFLATDPPPEAIKQLMTGLARVPDHPFPMDRWLLGDGQCFGDWFQRLPEGFEGLRFKDRSHKDEILREYRENIRKFAALDREPYFKSGEAVNAMWAAIEKHIKETADDPAKDNPLMREVFLPLQGTYVRCSLGDARLRMLRIIASAAMHKAENGAYPDTLEKLAKYFPTGVPKDPFTGKDFLYRLKDGLPRIESDPPESARAASSFKAELASLDLGRRRQQDAEALKGFLEKPAAK